MDGPRRSVTDRVLVTIEYVANPPKVRVVARRRPMGLICWVCALAATVQHHAAHTQFAKFGSRPSAVVLSPVAQITHHTHPPMNTYVAGKHGRLRTPHVRRRLNSSLFLAVTSRSQPIKIARLPLLSLELSEKTCCCV